MALTDENGMVMPVGPMYGGNGGFGGGLGNDWGWIILLLLFAGGGWGNGFGGYGGGELYPWMNQAEITTGGFQNAATNQAISSLQNSVTSGFGDVQNALCSGFGQAEISANARQMADMQQMFGIQTSLQNCCCENRAGLADLKFTVAQEACADRQSVNDALRDVLTANTANTQRILDQMCADKIDSKNEKIADLERQLTMAQLVANNNAQTQTLLADNFAQTNALEQYLAPVPKPAYIVQNPNCCSSGCGNF